VVATCAGRGPGCQRSFGGETPAQDRAPIRTIPTMHRKPRPGGRRDSRRIFGDDVQMSAMNASSRYEINAPDVVAEDFNGQVVILNLANGHYFSLRGIASPIWSLLLAGHTPESILGSIGAKRPELVEGSVAFLGRLVELNLLRSRVEGAAGPASIADDIWSGDSPQIEVFDDLAELIFADPIHDVDERTGWPTPRPAQ
jgi:hypothetical protein